MRFNVWCGTKSSCFHSKKWGIEWWRRIPLLMPGESAGPEDGPYLSYLRALEEWDRQFPGFEHDTHGVDCQDGRYRVSCLKRA